jgi:HK97 gp10 family phage protein
MKIEWFGKEVEEKIKAIVHAVSRDGAHLIARHTRQAIPWDTGVLATSVEVKKSRYDGYMVVVQGKGNYEKYYASFVELGSYKDEAKPYLRPSMHKNKQTIYRMYRDALK